MYLAQIFHAKADEQSLTHSLSWLAYWERNKRKRAFRCSNLGCLYPAEVGAQVYLVVEHKDKKPFVFHTDTDIQYIIPLCKKCSDPSRQDGMKVLKTNLVKQGV